MVGSSMPLECVDVPLVHRVGPTRAEAQHNVLDTAEVLSGRYFDIRLECHCGSKKALNGRKLVWAVCLSVCLSVCLFHHERSLRKRACISFLNNPN